MDMKDHSDFILLPVFYRYIYFFINSLMHIPERIAGLIIRYLQGELSPAESEELQEWADSSDNNRALLNELMLEDFRNDQLREFENGKRNAWEKISREIKKDKIVVKKVYSNKKHVVIYAAALLTIAAAIFLWINYQPSSAVADQLSGINAGDSIMPANGTPVLTRANGQRILLNDSLHGTLVSENGVDLVIQKGGYLIYQPVADAGNRNNKLLCCNTISTSRGKQYHFVLSDGTGVWLNAESSVSYPAIFKGKERKVRVTGEAYFEVSPSRVPFIIDIAGKGRVEVLGTRFNVNAYDDEGMIYTTLVEGSVRVQSTPDSHRDGSGLPIAIGTAVLKPGQQAVITHSSWLTIHDTPDIDQVLAWKNGLFIFRSADIRTILRQAARWYDIEVVYAENAPGTFTGTIARDVSLGEFLQILLHSEVRFTLEGKRLIIGGR
jgi:transmembrane sensor